MEDWEEGFSLIRFRIFNVSSSLFFHLCYICEILNKEIRVDSEITTPPSRGRNSAFSNVQHSNVQLFKYRMIRIFRLAEIQTSKSVQTSEFPNARISGHPQIRGQRPTKLEKFPNFQRPALPATIERLGFLARSSPENKGSPKLSSRDFLFSRATEGG